MGYSWDVSSLFAIGHQVGVALLQVPVTTYDISVAVVQERLRQPNQSCA